MGGGGDPTAPNFPYVMHRMLAPPGGLTPPPTGNPGSALTLGLLVARKSHISGCIWLVC